MSDETQPPQKSLRGFASMTPERRRELGSMGGKAVGPKNRAFSKDPELARAAGKKGSLVEDKSFAKNRTLAGDAGMKGATARWWPKMRGAGAVPGATPIVPDEIIKGRHLLGWTRTELAKRAGISRATLSNIEAQGRLSEGAAARIRATMEAAGVEFWNEGQPGVRMKAKSEGGTIDGKDLNSANDT